MSADRPGIDWRDWLVRAERRLAEAALGPEAELLGRVVEVGDGVARVAGLPEVALDEIVAFGAPGDPERLGFTVALEAGGFSAVILDDPDAIEAGMPVRGTGRVVDVPVGEALLGRVLDPLGRPLDDGPPPAAQERLSIERPAPAVVERDLVTEPVETGVLTVDALFALGRGQRELIIGDQATGRTALAVDVIINQRSSDIVCVYVAVGQRATAVAQVIEAVRRHGAPERCIFVVAPSAAPPGLRWLAPFAGMSMGEWFRDRGGHALVVIDDLTQHAATHRELALLTGEVPGREAYPGDVFYTHARLLERAAKLAPARGGGSLTALPIAETEAGNLAAYIPTNLISITDGQLVMDRHLFAANQRPAINIGLSVSRVGGKTQNPALRRVAGRMRLDYAQFLELEMFTRFGGVSDARIRARLRRGERIRALLTQPRFSPLPVPAQVALLAALGEGVLDALPVAAVPALRERLRHGLEAAAPAAVATVRAGEGDLDQAIARLVEVVREMAAALDAPGRSGQGGGGA